MKKKKKRKHGKQDRGQDVKIRETSEEGEPGDAPLQFAVKTVGGKWKLRILWALRSGKPLRYVEIKGAVEGITDMMLSTSLKELVSAGLVERRAYQEVPPKVEYAAMPAAAGLFPAIEKLCGWAEKRLKEIK